MPKINFEYLINLRWTFSNGKEPFVHYMGLKLMNCTLKIDTLRHGRHLHIFVQRKGKL